MYFHQYLLTLTIFCTSEAIKKVETVGCSGKIYNPVKKFGRSRTFKEIRHDLQATNIPEKFDARLKWPYCSTIGQIRDQGLCGGCWAFASAEVMSDRICIATKGKFNQWISVQDLLECCTTCILKKNMVGGCKGGTPYRTFEHWVKFGVVTGEKGCKPPDKELKDGESSTQCREKCTNEKYKVSYEEDKWYAKEWYVQMYPGKKGLGHIQIELMTHGPLLANMFTFDYLNKYNQSSKLFTSVESTTIIDFIAVITFQEKLLKEGEKPGIHAIKIIGWDVVNGTPVWIFANSWGTNWCDKGFCYIKRGSNELNIETLYMATGIPNLDRKSPQKIASSASVILKVIFFNSMLGLLPVVITYLV